MSIRARAASIVGVSEAFEVSPDDPRGVAEAIERASRGSTVHLVRDGRPVADIVPTPASATRTADARPHRDPRHAEVVAEHAARFAAPRLEHYRQVYVASGQDWPGEDYIRTHYPVADES